MVLLMPLLLFLSMSRWTDDYDAVLVANVESDLRIAEQYLSRLMEETGTHLRAVSNAQDFSATRPAEIQTYLTGKMQTLSLDFLYFQPQEQAQTSPWPVITAAANGAERTAIDVFTQSTLSGLSPGLAARARVPLIDTQAAVPSDRTIEDRGMVIHAAVPVDLPGRRGVLVGGILLNRNLAFIDTINALVYADTDQGRTRQGTATLFLDDVRISTNVRLFDDVRALGTRVSAAVRNDVLVRGQTWLNRAFVVNDWYISGYMPLTDSFGANAGMLYVGFLETPFNTAKRNAFLTILAVVSGVLLVSAPLFLWLAKGIFAPLERMTRTMELVQRGNLSARNNQANAADEIGQVAGHLDDLLDRVQARDRALRSLNDDLNARVEARTAELKRANEQLETTFRQLVVSEKLASIGEITAGVAHEINNPVAVIQGNLDVIRETLGDQADAVQTELRLLDRQVGRIQSIVGKLLQFAKPGDFLDPSHAIAVVPVITECLVLVDHQIAQSNLRVETRFAPVAEVPMDPGELEQVLVNLIVNAIQAMDTQDGVLTLTTAPQPRDGIEGVQIEVLDTGPGIPEAQIDQVFAPFYTTKQAQGTGLGLSISQTLIQRAGGMITAHNRDGGGTCFRVWLPAHHRR